MATPLSVSADSTLKPPAAFWLIPSAVWAACRSGGCCRKNWPMSEQDALDILTLVSLIHRKLDGTIEVVAVSP